MTGRPRLICGLLILLSALVVFSYVRAWAAIGSPLDRTSDFAAPYVAATLWRDGHADRVYSLSSENAGLRAEGAPADHAYIPFIYPPAALVLALPLTFVDGGVAYRIWSIIQVSLLLLALLITVRSVPRRPRLDPLLPVTAVAVAVAGTGTGLLLLEAQWDGLSALGLAAAYACWRRDRGFAAGLVLALGAGIAKPHLALGLAAFMIGSRDLRALIGAAAGAAVLGIASLAIAGVSGVGAFAAALSDPGIGSVRGMLGFSGLFGSWLGPGRATDLLTLGFGAAALGLCAGLGDRVRRRPDLLEPGLAGATVLSLLLAPHLLGHDLAVLAPMLVAVLAWLQVRTAAEPLAVAVIAVVAVLAGWMLLSVAARVDLGNESAAPPGRLVPWALLVAAVAAVWTVVLRPGLTAA